MHFVQYNIIVGTRDGICLITSIRLYFIIYIPFFQNPSSFHPRSSKLVFASIKRSRFALSYLRFFPHLRYLTCPFKSYTQTLLIIQLHKTNRLFNLIRRRKPRSFFVENPNPIRCEFYFDGFCKNSVATKEPKNGGRDVPLAVS